MLSKEEFNTFRYAVNNRVALLRHQGYTIDDITTARLKKEIAMAVLNYSVSIDEALDYVKEWIPNSKPI